MRVLAFRHVPFEHLGRIEPELVSRGIGIDYADLYQPGTAAPDPARYDGLIFMGGAMSVNDRLPHLEQEVRWIGQAAEARQTGARRVPGRSVDRQGVGGSGLSYPG